ncbi:RBM7 protein, partial [Aegotheles bennettii]|nr:RBM7 protein [Aegotheles bennettii]
AGPVLKVKIPRDRDGRPKQFAFVNFKHEESVPYGLSLLNGIKLYGRPIKIQFRAGSSHASQDGNLSSSSHGATGTPHPASNCSRYGSPRHTHSSRLKGAWFGAQGSRFGVLLSADTTGALTYEPPGYQPPAHTFHPPPAPQLPRRPEVPALRKARLSTHPYHPDSRHFGRDLRFDYGRGKWEDYGFEERGHDAEHHYRGGREEPAYEDRHREGWNHDYDYRREGYREPKWHPARH